MCPGRQSTPQSGGRAGWPHSSPMPAQVAPPASPAPLQAETPPQTTDLSSQRNRALGSLFSLGDSVTSLPGVHTKIEMTSTPGNCRH